ncbi:MAG: hypothetical protein ACYCZF_06080 [Anaerolineae bacterium]
MPELVDKRDLIIKEFSDPYDLHSLSSMAVVYLPSGKASLEDILTGIDEAKSSFSGNTANLVYSITDHRSYFNLGCSGSIQAIELAVLEGAVSGLAEAFITNLIEWCRYHFTHRMRIGDLSEPIEEAKQIITNNFTPQGNLCLTELISSDNEIKLSISDELYKYSIKKTLKPIISLHIRKQKL